MKPKKDKLYFFDYTKPIPFVVVDLGDTILWKEKEVSVSRTDALLCIEDKLKPYGIPAEDVRGLGLDPNISPMGHKEQVYVFLVKNKLVPVSPADIKIFNMKEFAG